MATVILVRHGRSTANASGILAGRAAGVTLDAVGRGQAVRAAERLAAVPLAAVISSPLVRCRQTARIIAAHQDGSPQVRLEKGLLECDYGQWQGGAPRGPPQRALWGGGGDH